MGNTLPFSIVPQTTTEELLALLAQAPKSQKYGGCDESANSSRDRAARSSVYESHEKVLPMSWHKSVTHVLIQCREVAVRSFDTEKYLELV